MADSNQTALIGDKYRKYQLSPEQLSVFHRDSILPLGQIFSQNELETVRAAFEAASKNARSDMLVIREEHSGEVRSIMGWQDASSPLYSFSRDSRVIIPVTQLINDDVVFHQTKFNPKAPSGRGEKWDPHRGITFWHYLDGVPNPDAIVSVFVALTDQTDQNGSTFTWLGAHKLDVEALREETDFGSRQDSDASGDTAASLSLQIRPGHLAEYERRFERVSLNGPAGSVWLLDSRNLHASQSNDSENVRILVANVYRGVSNVPSSPRGDEALCCTNKTALRPVEPGWAEGER